ncbi:hypothetical protein [Streptomyces griseoluteus]
MQPPQQRPHSRRQLPAIDTDPAGQVPQQAAQHLTRQRRRHHH